MNIYEKLLKIQMELKAPKNQTNKFGGYKYRSCEDILEALKPLCEKYKASLILNDDIINIGDKNYIKATASLYNTELDKNGHLEVVCNNAFAREAESKKGFDESQITGTASSYARKYALNGLFNIDDTKDADTDEFTERTKQISDAQIKGLRMAINNRNIKMEQEHEILDKYGYKNISEILIKDYKKIADEFSKLVEE